ncbi:1-alkyl-2-acetylglycerophosphocholine esterase [Malassezia cuniculi]|uniref:Putative phospholipase n=1 Tax=Malassezia cuniculi TaxID=948313 RepID=A0AAF0J7K4_9BASI|nr:1-alkyl-2-acetylglycerophosphocholine esterase [Malassezia cuniculi]
MHLPSYSGPFAVGAVDIEIPVREPLDYYPSYVDPVRLNKVIRFGKKIHINDGKKLSEKLKKAQEEDEKRGTDTHKKRFEEDALNEGYRLKSSTLMLRTVLFTLYYPSEELGFLERRKYGHVRWLGRPKRRMLRFAWNYLGQYGGYAKAFWPPLLRLLFAQIGARVGLPLGDPSKVDPELGKGLAGDSAKDQKTEKFPVLIFSHGLAGNRLAYSQYCGELASRGFVVAAVEHRDGSGMGGFMWTSGELSRSAQKNIRLAYKQALYYGANETEEELFLNSAEMQDPESPFACQKVHYFPFEQVGMAPFAAEQGPHEQHMRQLQLAMRRKEIFEALHVLRRLDAGDHEALAHERTRSLGAMLCGRRRFMQMRTGGYMPRASEFLKTFKGKLDVAHPAIAGHSFGGATLLELLRTDQKDFKYGIVLDPWVEPVLDPHNNPNIRGKLRTPIYVINSEAFTMWRSLYSKLHRIMHDAIQSNPDNRGWLMTMCGTNHGDFSDLPILLPRIFASQVRPMEAVLTFTEATYQQIKLSRQQVHLSEIISGKVPDDLGDDKHLIRESINHEIPESANEDSTSEEEIGTASDAHRRKRPVGGFNLWEFSGWWHMRQDKRAGKRGWLVASNEITDLGKLLLDKSDDENNEALIYLDPRNDISCWTVPGFDPDAKTVYENMTTANNIPEHRT